MLDLAVIGGGAAGFFTAINVARRHPGFRVAIFEKSRTVLGKVRISGGGRCNVTHACYDHRLLTSYYPRGSKELLSVFHRFGPADTIRWFASEGIVLKTEADGRVFPVSDRSETITECFEHACKNLSIPVHTAAAVTAITKDADGFSLMVNQESIRAKRVLVACGSSEYFWDILRGMGIHIIDPVPSLFTFNISHPLLEDLQGLSVASATVRLLAGKDVMKEFRLSNSDLVQQGPLLITHWGLSGPAILKLSSVAARLLHSLDYRFEISLNLSNADHPDRLLEYLQTVKEEMRRKQVVNTALFGIPQRWWQRIHSLCFDTTFNTWSDVSHKELQNLASKLYDFRLPVNGKSTFKEEFVTAGGVDLKEVDFKTMESKKIPSLYFAGEVLNIDALTGGFNFQAAWSEAWVISESV